MGTGVECSRANDEQSARIGNQSGERVFSILCPDDFRSLSIVLDSKLVDRVKRLANVKTTRDAVHVALEHYVRSRDYSGVLALRGTGGVSEGYDPKAASPPR
jgi:Arc/MetJ family transcription regulator